MEPPEIRATLIAWLKQYMNDFCTPEGFAEYHGISKVEAIAILRIASHVEDSKHPDQ